MQASILKGIYTDAAANYLTSYPVNLEPVIGENGVSKGYLRSSPGITTLATAIGVDRGSINWRDFGYRVSGSRLVRVSGAVVTNLGDVGGTDQPVTFDYSFDRLAIASNGNLFYWDGATLSQVTDPDLGVVVDFIWIDGYFLTTDGQYLVVTDLDDPYSVNPLKYGSSEADPDEIVALMKVRNEAYALNQYTIENFQNVGGNGFPFARNPGGEIPKGVVGTFACAYFLDTFAFVGGGRNEAPSVYLAGYGEAIRISTPQIDREIAAVPWNDRRYIVAEAIEEQGEQRLLIHLPTKTLVYSRMASQAAGEPIWSTRAGGTVADEQYPGRFFVYAEGRWTCGQPAGDKIGYLDESVDTLFDDTTGWQFDTMFFYNAGRGGILKAAELVALTGRTPTATNPTAGLSLTQDGMTWGQERSISMGTEGQRRKRMQWRPKTLFSNFIGLRFRASNTALASFSRLEVDVEALSV